LIKLSFFIVVIF